MRKILFRIAVVMTVACTVPQDASAFCFEEAAHYYGISESILRGIAQQESGMNPTAIGWNANGTYDFGLMQINTINEPMLRKVGIPWESLADPCTNVMAGAWLLANHIKKYGYSWEAIGAYHSATPSKRDKYARQIAGLVFGGKY